VTADDVKFSYDRLAFDSRSVVRGAFVSLDNVEVVDKYTVKFTSKLPSALLIENARKHPAWIIPKELVERDGNIMHTMLGAGPFYLEKTVAGVGWTLTRNPNYFESPKPYPDGVRWLLVTDRAAQTAAFRSGQTAVLGGLKKPEMQAVAKTNPQASIVSDLQGGTTWFVYKADEPDAPWADKRVRVATSKAIDRDAIIAGLYGGAESDWGGIIYVGYKPYGLTMDEKRKIYNLQYDPAAAKQLMKEAGFPNGFKANVAYTSAGGTIGPELLMGTQMVKEQLKIDFVLQAKETAAFLADGYAGNYKQVIYMGLGGTSTWFELLQFTHYSKGKWPTSKINDPEHDKIIEDIFATFDEKERVRKVKEFQYHLLNDHLFYIPMPGSASYRMTQPWFHDYNEVAVDLSFYADFWVSK